MPLLYIKDVCSDSHLGLWRLTEPSIEDFGMPAIDRLCHRLAGLKSPKRQLEVAATHALLHTMTGETQSVIDHNEAGKPLLEGWNISVSHTQGYVAVMLSRSHAVAVDVEYVSERVNKIADRFLSEAELRDAITTRERLLRWCAKETAYKFYSQSNLTFHQMLTSQASTSSTLLLVRNKKDNRTLTVQCETTNDFVIAYSLAEL